MELLSLSAFKAALSGITDLSKAAGGASRQQIFDLHRKFPYSNTCCVVNRRRDRTSYARQADLADSPSAKFINLFVRIVKKIDVDRSHVSAYRHHIMREIAVDGRAFLRIVRGVLQQCHADSHRHRALDLVPAG